MSKWDSTVVDGTRSALGYSFIPVGNAAVGVAAATNSTLAAVPAGASVALVVVEGADVRWRDDGTNPTAAIGVPLIAGGSMWYTGADISALKFIRQAADATVHIVYYD